MTRSSTHPMAIAAVVAAVGAAAYWALSLLVPFTIAGRAGGLLLLLLGTLIPFAVGFIVGRRVEQSPIAWAGVAGLTMSLFILLIGLMSYLVLRYHDTYGWTTILANTLSIAFRVGVALLGGWVGALRGSGMHAAYRS